MTFPIRVLTIATGATVFAMTLSAQSTFGVAPDTTIGVQLQVVPFSLGPGYRPRTLTATFVAPEALLSCPMPVDGTNTSNDTAMVSRSNATVPPAPMPGANAMRVCANPLRRPTEDGVRLW